MPATGPLGSIVGVALATMVELSAGGSAAIVP
jgi:hypothetical protein